MSGYCSPCSDAKNSPPLQKVLFWDNNCTAGSALLVIELDLNGHLEFYGFYDRGRKEILSVTVSFVAVVLFGEKPYQTKILTISLKHIEQFQHLTREVIYQKRKERLINQIMSSAKLCVGDKKNRRVERGPKCKKAMYTFNKKLKLSEQWGFKYLFVFIYSRKKLNSECWER